MPEPTEVEVYAPPTLVEVGKFSENTFGGQDPVVHDGGLWFIH